MSTDPLLRAIARGDRNCPDGASLARLGELARHAGEPAPRDLRARVQAALDAAPTLAADADADGEEAGLEAHLSGAAADPALARLQELLRAQRPKRVDLRDRVRRAIAPASLRITPQQAAATGRRWRIVAAIAAAHVAVFLLFTTISGQNEATGTGAATASRAARTTGDAMPVVTATTWDRLHETHGDLVGLRRDATARESARSDAGLADTARLVQGCLAWLIARQDPVSGRIGVDATGDRAAAVQALAVLALLGEGGGDQTRLARARLALGPVAANMAGTTPLSPTALGASALALVEGALVTGDPEVRLQARAGLLRLARELPGRPGEGGLAGLGWLALEAAAAGGLEPPRGAVDAARERIARPLPSEGRDAGRVGLAAFARLIGGQRADNDTRQQLGRLEVPKTDAAGRIDALAWFMAGLAMHEDGGVAWRAWATGLGKTLAPHLHAAGPGLFQTPADAVRFAEGADGDILATSAVVLALQTPYRYVALARE